MEREVGGGIGMGNTCNSMADSCQWMTNPLKCCEVISLQLIKINEKKKKQKQKYCYFVLYMLVNYLSPALLLWNVRIFESSYLLVNVSKKVLTK